MDQCHPRDPGGARLTVIEGAGNDARKRTARIVTSCQQHSNDAQPSSL